MCANALAAQVEFVAISRGGLNGVIFPIRNWDSTCVCVYCRIAGVLVGQRVKKGKDFVHLMASTIQDYIGRYESSLFHVSALSTASADLGKRVARGHTRVWSRAHARSCLISFS